MEKVRLNSFFLSVAGGVLDFLTADGEVAYSVAVPPGRVAARDYFDIVPDGGEMRVAEGLSLVQPKSGFGMVPKQESHHESAVNPDFQVTSATRMEREMRLTLARMNAASSRLEARERALSRIERMPTAPVEPDPVIEPVDPVQPTAENVQP